MVDVYFEEDGGNTLKLWGWLVVFAVMVLCNVVAEVIVEVLRNH